MPRPSRVALQSRSSVCDRKGESRTVKKTVLNFCTCTRCPVRACVLSVVEICSVLDVYSNFELT